MHERFAAKPGRRRVQQARRKVQLRPVLRRQMGELVQAYPGKVQVAGNGVRVPVEGEARFAELVG